MGLETATFIDQLVTTNPTGGDQKLQGDDHIRLLKTVLKATFPGLNSPVTFGGWHSKDDAVNLQVGAYTLQSGDNGKLIHFTLSANATFALLPAATVGNGFVCWVQMSPTTFELTIDADGSETINGSTTITLCRHEGGLLYCSGGQWFFIGMAASLATSFRMVQRAEDNATAQSGIHLRRIRSGAVANSDLGTTIRAEHKNSAGTTVQVGNISWQMKDVVGGSEDAHWYIENIIGGAIATADRLWKGQGLYADGLNDPGQKASNFLKIFGNNDQVLPLEDLTQLTVSNIAFNDRVLVRDTSANDHMYARACDLGGWVTVSKLAPSAVSSLDVSFLAHQTNYENFRVRWKLTFSNDGVDLQLRTSQDNSAFDAGAGNYSYAAFTRSDANTILSQQSSSATACVLNHDGIGNAAGEGCQGHVEFVTPVDAVFCKYTGLNHVTGTGGVRGTSVLEGTRETAATVQAIRLLASAGTFTGSVWLEAQRKIS